MCRRTDSDAQRYENDPKLGPGETTAVRSAIMGDILHCIDETLELPGARRGFGPYRTHRNPQPAGGSGDLATV